MADVLRVGNVEMFQVVDALVRGDPKFLLPSVSDEMWSPYRHWLDERGLLNMTIGTYVIRSQGKTVLIDTGLGDKPREGFPLGNMLGNLLAEGIPPEDVDIVVNTHLHIDHVGWNTVSDGKGGWRVTFPNAKFVFQQADWDYWTQPEIAAQNACIEDSVLPLKDSPQLELATPDFKVTDELSLIPSPGHTPGHVCVAIVSGGQHAVIIGDMCHHPVQVSETSWSPVFDVNPTLSAETRGRIVQELARQQALFIGGHFPAPGFGRVVDLGERRYWEAVAVPAE
jgi:glyoxylase-like metal-dependent hydrolase (beta-lactamase superfamily II)